MSKKVTTTERYDAFGKLVERVVVTEETDDESQPANWNWDYTPYVVPVTTVSDRTRNCPCRPENGGSGVCGCILGAPQVTCNA